MAVKSVISIDIDDSDFQRFAATFRKYSEELKTQPTAWHDVAASSAAAAAAAAEMGVAVGVAAGELHKTNTESEVSSGHARRTAGFWSSIAQSAGKFTSRVVEATRSLLRWGELTGLISGILGAGGLFGIDRLATSAGEQRKRALGLGVTPGEAKAFDVDYGRVVDTGAFLSGVNQALHDVTKRVGLYGAGITEQEMKGKDTAEVGSELLTHLKKIADQTPDAMLGNVLTARHLDQFVTLEQFQRLKNTPAGEMEEYKQSYQRDTHDLELTRETTKAWQDLQVQLGRAGAEIENSFIRGLTDLAGPIGNLSAAFTKLVEDLLNSKVLREWINDLAGGIRWLGDEIDKPEFRDHVISFMEGVDHLATKVVEFVENVAAIVETLGSAVTSIKTWFGGLDPKQALSGDGVNGPFENPLNDPGSPELNEKRHPERFNADHTPKDRPADTKEPWDETGWRQWMPWNWHMMHATPAPTPEQKTRFDELEGSHKLPAGTLNAVMQAESHGDPNATSPKGAKGQFQFMDKTADSYGVQNSRDFTQASGGAARYLHSLLQEFGGDLAKAAAGYNWGEQNVEKDIAVYHEKWREHLPPETQRYVAQVTAGQSANPQPKFVPPAATRSPVVVKLYPEPGANPYISTSQLAY